jgi:serine/threonine protein kinase/class 3 adenylate cyclase
MESSQSASLRTMVARVSPDDIVIYANGALAAYLKVRKRELVGSPLEVLASRARGEISSCFARPETGRTSNHLVTDADGRVFEAKAYSDGGVLDIVLDEVSTAESIGRELRAASGTPFDSLSEDELRTTRHPERRYLTVSHTLLRGIAGVADRLAPMEVRLMVNSFVEEASDAILDAGCTVGETSGDSVLGIYGAPRYFADHPMRAIRAACEQMQKAANLHAGLYREGKELPPCSCGIWTGDTLVGTLGNSVWQHYTALGAPVDLARKLASLARPGEILVPEHTLTHLLRVLPEGWEHLRAESENEPDLSDFQWTGDEVAPVPEHLRKIVYLVGPGVKDDTDRTEFYFDYLWAFRVPGRDQEIPILRVMRPSLVGDSLELSNENVVTTQIAQTLGKYKLVEVIGVGGMGKVWRGVDRFGNSVAIKVLHSNETVTEAQIKRFRREAEIMAKLPHRNICRVFEMNEFESIHYIAMEFVDGLSLSDLLYEKTTAESSGQSLDHIDLKALISSLRSEKPLRDEAERQLAESGEEPPVRPKKTRILPVEQTLSILLKVCEAVQFAHEHGVLHRDLKPGNILLREDGEPLVADFGLAKLSSPDATRSLSMTGHVVGTLENMSPEQAESSKDVDERADVYSIGTILYQMLTGRRHFEATGNIVADAQTLKTHEPQRLRVYNPQVESDLEIITLKALRNDPVERYRSIAALRADLEHYRRGEVISARPVSWAEVTRKMIQRNKGVATAVLASCVIFVVGTLAAIGVLSKLLSEKTQANRAYQAEQEKVRHQQQLVDEKQAENDAKQARLDEQEKQMAAALAELQDKATQAALAEKNARLQEERANKVIAELATTRAEKDTEIEKRQETERSLDDAREKLSQANQERLDELLSRPDRPRGPGRAGLPDPQNLWQLQEAFKQANQILGLELSPFALQKDDMDAATITRILAGGLESLSAALLLNRDFLPAWTAKGRLHLALMEFDEAAKSYAEAARAETEGPFPLPPGENPKEMQEFTEDLARSPGDKTKKAIEKLRRYSDPLNQNVAAIMEVLDKTRKTSAGIERPLSGSEAALALREAGGPDVQVHSNAEEASLIIWGTEELPSLAPLKNKQLSSLAIVGAKTLDWPTLQSLPLETLELSGCGFEVFPLSVRSFLKVKTLRLSGTPIANIDFVRYLPQLQSLDISDTHVIDLTPLRNVRLQELNIAGLDPANFRILGFLPLRVLTLSPMLIGDKAALASLRMHRNLRVLRTPDDPADQSATEFWRKFDSGFYNEAR